ncbi:uncharacterized protein [Triticum aestivum]|uniref:uncharacterized protein isoform X2 n=1 Tax=Triticum aestivum TaxID=4565 RepID=UPI001D01180F|nr:uncharacterized protein LOC123127285 isoform X2 [Triticum aestivum]XP_044402868.1 uncharacterized protein LOC123127285 isoform X2 [Triticum aestivum]
MDCSHAPPWNAPLPSLLTELILRVLFTEITDWLIGSSPVFNPRAPACLGLGEPICPAKCCTFGAKPSKMNSTISEATAQPESTRSGTVCTAITTTTTSVSRTRAIRAQFSAAPKNSPIPVVAELADPQQKQTLDRRGEFLTTRYRRPSTSLSRVMVFMHLPSC